MKIEPSKRMKRAKSGKPIYTHLVTCSFRLQYSFGESEVEQDPEGAAGDLQPTDKALRVLEKDLTETLRQDYCVTDLQVEAESDQLLGTVKE
jgi:hypothetical protein